jgi:hypothetical protein
MKSILDRSFHYTPSSHTDLKKTFARVRREQRLYDRDTVKAAAEVKLKSRRSDVEDARQNC